MARRIKQAVVLAAGFGTRLRPLTEDIPKPAIHFLNRPVIHHILDQLLDHGIEKLFVNLSHLPGIMRGALRPYEEIVEIIYSEEKSILGTAGVFSNFKKDLDDRFFVVNGDVFSTLPLDELGSALSDGGAEAVFMLKKNGPDSPYTPLRMEPDGRISSIGSGSHFFCGAYAASSSFLSPVRSAVKMELVNDLMIPKIDKGVLKGVEFGGEWFDLGGPRAFLEASGTVLRKIAEGRTAMPEENHLIERGGLTALVHDSACIDTSATLMGFAVIGEGCRVEKEAKLENVVLLPGTVISRSTEMKNAIIYKGKMAGA